MKHRCLSEIKDEVRSWLAAHQPNSFDSRTANYERDLIQRLFDVVENKGE